MDKFTLERDFDNELIDQGVKTREPKKIVFNVPKDLNIYEFRIMCIRMSEAMGFGEDNILDAFQVKTLRKLLGKYNYLRQAQDFLPLLVHQVLLRIVEGICRPFQKIYLSIFLQI